MTPAELASLAPRVVALARAAGEAILRVYAQDFEVTHKSDRSPLTEADLAAHAVLARGLEQLTPGLPILSEEALHAPYDERREWRRLWLIDPLDGTREFVKRNGEFTVNVALIEDGAPVLGVVLAPVLDEFGCAVRGGEAWHERGGVRAPLARPTRADGPLRVAGSRSHPDPRTQALLDRLGPHDLVSLGSALKFVRLAAGEIDLYVRYGPTSEWDTAAGQCLVEAVGGSVTSLGGEPLRYNQRDSLLNPDFVASVDRSRDWLRFV